MMRRIGYAVAVSIGLAVGALVGNPLAGAAQSTRGTSVAQKSAPSAVGRYQIIEDSKSILPIILLDSQTGLTWHICTATTNGAVTPEWCAISPHLNF